VKTSTKLWIGVAAMIALSPLGLILPAKLNAGSAWGEWSAEEMRRLVGYVPAGMSRLGGLWKAPLPDYAFKGAPFHSPSVSYIASAILGVAIVVGITILVGKALAHRER
jgi:hypothetical protein